MLAKVECGDGSIVLMKVLTWGMRTVMGEQQRLVICEFHNCMNNCCHSSCPMAPTLEKNLQSSISQLEEPSEEQSEVDWPWS
jgi:hypothetical protein